MAAIGMDIWSIVIIIAIGQGLFVISIMVLKSDWKQYHNYFLCALLLFFIWLQLEFLSIRIPFSVGFNLFYSTRHGSWLLIGPLYFFYARFIIEPNRKLILSDLLHFSPFLLFSIIIPVLTQDFLSFRQVHYGMLTAFDQYNDKVTVMQYLYSSVFVLQLVHLFGYLLLVNRRLTGYSQLLKQSYSDINENDVSWLRNLGLILIAILVFAAIFLIIFFFTRKYRRHMDYLYVLPMSILMYIVSYKLLNAPWKKIASTNGIMEKKYLKSSLDEIAKEGYVNQLEAYIETHKPYLDNELRLQKLASALNIPHHHLSQIINEEFGSSFFDFINKYRVEEAKKLIASSRDNVRSLLQIAFEAGFNNKTSFNNAFKKFTGETPAKYRKKFHTK